jgi:hypothetical protein
MPIRKSGGIIEIKSKVFGKLHQKAAVTKQSSNKANYDGGKSFCKVI